MILVNSTMFYASLSDTTWSQIQAVGYNSIEAEDWEVATSGEEMSKMESLLLDKNRKMEHELTQMKVCRLFDVLLSFYIMYSLHQLQIGFAHVVEHKESYASCELIYLYPNLSEVIMSILAFLTLLFFPSGKTFREGIIAGNS